MRRTVCAVALLLCAEFGSGADLAPSLALPAEQGPWVVRAYFDSKAQLATVTRRSEPWEVHHDQGYAVVEVANRYEYSLLIANGMRVAIDSELTELLRNPPAALRSIPAFACYRTVEETFASIDQLVAAHPALASSIDIGDSWEKVRNPALGHDLRVLRLSNAAIAGPKPRVFVIGAIHAREYATAETLMRFAEHLLARYADDADVRFMLDHFELHLLPQANPDGRKKAELGQSWRKNVNENYCGATSSQRGADLNRNFPFEWGAHGGSSGAPCDSTFRGAAAASEPETAAIIAHLQTLFPDQRPPDLTTPASSNTSGVFLDVHSYGELVLWPWGFDSAVAPNGTALATFGRRLGAINGYRPQQGIELYVTDGGTKDFAYGELGVAALSFELGTSFFQNCESFEANVLERNVAALTYLLRNARRPYLEPAGPSIEDLLTAPVEVGEPARLIGRANDAAFNQSNGNEPAQAVAAVDVYVNRVPWSEPALPDAQALAIDNSFDTPSEQFLVELDSKLAVGRHAIHLRARDEHGAGPTFAHYVDVVAPGSTARLAGTVRNANSGEPLSVPATVRLGDYGTLALPADSAGYALRAPMDTYALTVAAPGYAPTTFNNIELTAATHYTQDVDLLPICTLFADDAGNGLANFSAQSPWGIGTTHYVSAPAAFTDSPAGNYAANANTALSLVPLDLRDVANVRLKFQSLCNTESGFDRGRVEVSTNGNHWTEVWNCSGSNTWSVVDLDLNVLNGSASAYIRFRFTSDTAVQLDGWSIDDIVIEGTGAVCGGPAPALFVDGFE